mmetsp:Transcript_31095/g.68887  ORF Transcript_31095/g.68887 Transcript_31095/m.68887 type:complete len:567 (-) Transcript_31095:106-1806(-)
MSCTSSTVPMQQQPQPPSADKQNINKRRRINTTMKRLSLSFLPNRGRVKIRQDPGIANLYIYEHYDPLQHRLRGGNGGRLQVGAVERTCNSIDEPEWREYDGVVFDEVTGLHHLRIKLNETERKHYASRNYASPPPHQVTHGWAYYEYTAKPIPKNKSRREPRFVLYHKPVVLISLFDGIGGGRVAIDKLPEQYSVVASFSSEKNDTAKAVVKRYDARTVELPNIEEIDHAVVVKKIFGNKAVREAMSCASYGDELHFLIIAGPPCQDLSQAKANKDGFVKGALEGEQSRFFFHVPRIVKMISDTAGRWVTHYLVENVEMTRKNERIFTEFLSDVAPWKVDFNTGGCCASLMSRRRLYFCSLSPGGGNIGLSDFARSGCIHPAKMANKTVDDVLGKLGWGEWKFVNGRNGTLPTLTRREHQGGQDRYQIVRKDDETVIRDAPQIINEDLLGFNIDHTKVGPEDRELTESERRLLLGNTFCVYHVQHILKMMHERICDPEAVAANGGKIIRELPQDICSRKLGQENISISDRKLYGNVHYVVNDILKFGEYEEKTKGTLLQHGTFKN